MTNGDKLSNIANLDKNDEISSEKHLKSFIIHILKSMLPFFYHFNSIRHILKINANLGLSRTNNVMQGGKLCLYT